MIYLARYAHLKYKPDFQPGDKIKRGQIIGRVGNTGKSTAAHLHFDLAQFRKEKHLPKKLYRLFDIPGFILDLPELMKQYNFYIDGELFGCPFIMTTSFGEPYYPSNLNTPPAKRKDWQFHPGYDLIPKDKYIDTIYHNRSADGTVYMVGTDSGYGNYIINMYEVK